LKSATRTARAEILTAELLDELLVVTDDAVSLLDVRLGRIPFAPLAHDLERGCGSPSEPTSGPWGRLGGIGLDLAQCLSEGRHSVLG
jgi:hypothetical protein